MAKIIKAESAKGQVYVNLYNRSKYYSVTDYYKNPSSEKRSAEKEIISQPECAGYKVLGGIVIFLRLVGLINKIIYT